MMRVRASLSLWLFNRLRANNEKLLSFPFTIEMEKLPMTSFDFPVSLTRMIHKKYPLVLVVDFKLVFYLEIRSK